jgi:hypothetical protein
MPNDATMLELKDEGRSTSHWACQNLMAGKRAAKTRLRVSRDKYKFKWDNMKRTGIASPYFHNSYIYIKIMLITSPKRTPLIKSSNMSTWKIRLHHMACYYKLQKKMKSSVL